MTVVLNEGALKVLLSTTDGPVGRFVERKAIEVRTAARRNVDDYFGSSASLMGDVSRDVDYEMDGSSAAIGYKQAAGGTGHKVRYLAQQERDGRLRNPILQAALAEVFPG